MSDASSSSSSPAAATPPPPSKSPRPPNEAPPPPGEKQGPPLAIQSILPHIISVSAPFHPILDTPEIRCWAWRAQTPRGRAHQVEPSLTSICFRRTNPHIHSHFHAERQANGLASGHVAVSPSVNRTLARVVENKAAIVAAENEEKAKEEMPKELSLLRGKFFDVNVDQGVVPVGTRRNPLEIQVESHPNGHFKDLSIKGDTTDFKKTGLGYEFYDSAGGYHYVVPLGVIHRRIYTYFADHLDRLYGPTFRVLNRYATSFENGHQLRMWNMVVDNARNGEGIKLGQKMWETFKSGAGKGSKGDDDPPDEPSP